MKCTAIAENLKKAFSITERASGKNLNLPILNSFHIKTDDGLLKVTSTNLEIGIETWVRATIQTHGDAVIPARIISSYIANLPRSEHVTLELKGDNLDVRVRGQKTVFKGYTKEDFPPFPNISGKYKISFKKADICNALQKSISATAKNDIKPELASVFVQIKNREIFVSATDSFRLVEERITPIDCTARNSGVSFLVPGRSCEEIIRVMESDSGDKAQFIIGSGELMVELDDARIYSRLVDGKFPEYEQIIPKQFETRVYIDKKLLVDNIKRASIFSGRLSDVKFTTDPDKGTCCVESQNRDIGEFTSTINVSAEGKPLSILFNYHYLLSGVTQSDGEVLFLGFNGESKPLVITPKKSSTFLYIVMPMKGL